MTDSEIAPPLTVDLAIADINGVLRGKRVPRAQLDGLIERGMNLPRSLLAVDIWGRDVHESGLTFETGDGDGLCRPVPGQDLAQSESILLTMFESDGRPCLADPRQVLTAIVEDFHARDLWPVMALEMEFYLLHPPEFVLGALAPEPVSSRGADAPQMYGMTELDAHNNFIDAMYAACAAEGLPVGAIIHEAGPGQYEVNLAHQRDPIAAADHALRFRYLVRQVAARSGWHATFMARPLAGEPGCSMHAHVSMEDGNGVNRFDESRPGGTQLLHSAVAGLLDCAAEMMLVCAPHRNSYRRFVEGLHAPVMRCWGPDNRTAAVRIPASTSDARRIEHRVSGADANPYLVVAALLAGIRHGIDNQLVPPEPLLTSAYESDLERLPSRWAEAVDAFESGTVIRHAFGPLLSDALVACKRQEMQRFADTITALEFQSCLDL